MSVAKSLWAMVQGDAVFMRKVNGILVWFWLANFIPVIAIYIWAPDAWEKASILYLALVSIYANVSGHWAAWQASRVEVRQEELNEEADEATVQAVKEEVRQVNKEEFGNGH